MKQYVPDPELWVRYYEDKLKSKKLRVVPIQPLRRVTKIVPTQKSSPPRDDLVKIEAISPLQQYNERVESEVKRMEKRKMTNDSVKQTGGSKTAEAPNKKRRIYRADSSGF